MASLSDWDDLEVVKGALKQLENGYFDRAAQIVDAMGRDDRIRAVCESRFRGILRLPFDFEEQGDKRRSSAVSKELTAIYPEIAPEHSLVDLQWWGHMLGVAVAENRYVLQPDDSTFSYIHVWHPRYVRWDYESERFILQTREGPVTLNPGDPQWIVFTPYGQRRGWMRSLVRALAVPWLVRQWAMRDAARHSEVWGSPTRVARVPAGAKAEDRKAFAAALSSVGSDTTLLLPAFQSAAGEKFDVELIEAVGQGAPFVQLMDKTETCFAIAVLGQNLTTEVKGGAYAAAQVHQTVRNDIIASDATLLSTCLREQHVKPYCAYNFGDPEVAPYPRWDSTPPEDKKTTGDALKALGDGILALQATGAHPDVDQLLEDAKVPVSEDAGPPPNPGLGVPRDGTQPMKPPEAPRPAARASRTPAPVTARKNEIEGQAFADELVERTKEAFAELHSVDVGHLKKLIADSKDYEGLRASLAPFMKGMEWKKKMKLLERAFIIAELNGSNAVVEGL